MGTCCCSLAGTRACDICSNGPSKIFSNDFRMIKPYDKQDWLRYIGIYSKTNIKDE